MLDTIFSVLTITMCQKAVSLFTVCCKIYWGCERHFLYCKRKVAGCLSAVVRSVNVSWLGLMLHIQRRDNLKAQGSIWNGLNILYMPFSLQIEPGDPDVCNCTHQCFILESTRGPKAGWSHCVFLLSLWVLLYGYLILLSVISSCPSCSLLILYCHLPWNVALPLLLTVSPPLLTINWNHSPFTAALVSKLSFRQQQLLTLERPLFQKCLRWP